MSLLRSCGLLLPARLYNKHPAPTELQKSRRCLARFESEILRLGHSYAAAEPEPTGTEPGTLKEEPSEAGRLVRVSRVNAIRSWECSGDGNTQSLPSAQAGAASKSEASNRVIPLSPRGARGEGRPSKVGEPVDSSSFVSRTFAWW